MLWGAKDRRTLRFVIPHTLIYWTNQEVIRWKYWGGLPSWYYQLLHAKSRRWVRGSRYLDNRQVAVGRQTKRG